MSNRFASGKNAISECDRCGQRFKLTLLKKQVLKAKTINFLVCPSCWDIDHPQLQLGMYPVSDPQGVRDPRPDTTYVASGLLADGSLGEGSRSIQWGWNPVGGANYYDTGLTPNYLIADSQVGTVTAENVVLPTNQKTSWGSLLGAGAVVVGSSNNVFADVYSDNVFSSTIYTGTTAAKSIDNKVPLSSTAAWWAVTLRQNANSVGLGIVTDSNGNIYATGYGNDGVTQYSSTSKYNSLGAIQWQRSATTASGGTGEDIAVDSIGNIYVVGSFSTGLYNTYIFKYDTSGTLIWQRKLANLSNVAYGVAIDSSDDIYITGDYADGSAIITLGVIKYNSSGTLIWQRQLRGNTGHGYGITTDSSGGIYVTGYVNETPTKTQIVAKYNSSGVIQWQRLLVSGNPSADSIGRGITADSSGNIYVTGHSEAYGTIVKYNSAGAIQWQRRITLGVLGSAGARGYNVRADSSGNVYVVGYVSEGSGSTYNYYVIVCKYNSAGIIQWHRMLEVSSSLAPALAIDNSNGVYVAMHTPASATNVALTVVRLAQDGSVVSGIANGVQMVAQRVLIDEPSTLTDSAAVVVDIAGISVSSAGTATESASASTYSYGAQAAVTSQGGLVWQKSRATSTQNNVLADTVTSVIGSPAKALFSDSISSLATVTAITAYNANGYTLPIGATIVNANSVPYASWTFAKASFFFDMVSYTGTGVNRTIPHSLRAVPGMIFVKRTDVSGDWEVYHRSLANTEYAVLNTTAAKATNTTMWNSATATEDVFSIGTNANVNAVGGTYIAYIFAHIISPTGIIQCGTYTTNASGIATVGLGWEPQYLMTKRVSTAKDWTVADASRQWPVSGIAGKLYPNLTAIETNGLENYPTATGFVHNAGDASATYIYMAIRRPNKPPTLGTQVYSGILQPSGSVAGEVKTTGFQVDLQIAAFSAGAFGPPLVLDRLRGVNTLRTTTTTSPYSYMSDPVEVTSASISNNWNNTGFLVASGFAPSTYSYMIWNFRRAPSVLDVVCYTGTGVATTQAHNLGVVPELILIKNRTTVVAVGCYSASLANTEYLTLNNSTNGRLTSTAFWNSTTPTSSVFTVGTAGEVNTNASPYVAYLFATLSGVSKVGSYTGNGSSQTINCGFTTGARFILIKRTDITTATGKWYVWDTTRGITAGNDPYLVFDVGTTFPVGANDSIDSDNSGFIVNQVAATDINVTSASYIYLSFS